MALRTNVVNFYGPQPGLSSGMVPLTGYPGAGLSSGMVSGETADMPGVVPAMGGAQALAAALGSPVAANSPSGRATKLAYALKNWPEYGPPKSFAEAAVQGLGRGLQGFTAGRLADAQQKEQAQEKAAEKAQADQEKATRAQMLARALAPDDPAKQAQIADMLGAGISESVFAPAAMDKLGFNTKKKGEGFTLGRTRYDENGNVIVTAPPENDGGKPPTVAEFFDEKTGLPYKATWDADTYTWNRIGGAKAPTGWTVETGPDGQTRITQGPVNAKPTEFQGKSHLYAARMGESDKIISQLEGVGTSLIERGKAQIPIAGNYMVSTDYQKLDQAERDFINATLRQESGATITPSEFENGRRQYFPLPGDGPEVLAQKRANRRLALQKIQENAGPAFNPPSVPGQPGEPAAPAADIPAAAQPSAAPPRPATVPLGSAYSPSRKMWKSPDGRLFDDQGTMQ